MSIKIYSIFHWLICERSGSAWVMFKSWCSSCHPLRPEVVGSLVLQLLWWVRGWEPKGLLFLRAQWSEDLGFCLRPPGLVAESRCCGQRRYFRAKIFKIYKQIIPRAWPLYEIEDVFHILTCRGHHSVSKHWHFALNKTTKNVYLVATLFCVWASGGRGGVTETPPSGTPEASLGCGSRSSMPLPKTPGGCMGEDEGKWLQWNNIIKWI